MIVVPPAVRTTIVERAREGAPEEVCGVLGGEYDPDSRSLVRSQYPAENVADRPRTRYRIDPEEQLAIFDRLEAHDEEIVGFYHSHPRGPPRPSATDKAQATWPDRSYVIVSLDPLNVDSWRWRAGAGDREEDASATADRFSEERLRLE